VAQLVEALRYKSEGRSSFPDGIIGIFHRHISFDRTMALGSAQPLTEMITRDGGKGGRCIGLTNFPPSRADCLEILQTRGALRICTGITFI
jgi:hypothetical protein